MKWLYDEIQKILFSLSQIRTTVGNLYHLMQELVSSQNRMAASIDRLLIPVSAFEMAPGADLMTHLAERGIGGSWYQRVGHDEKCFQLVCRGTLLCNEHPSVVEPAPSRACRGVQHVCRECNKICDYRPCGRVLIVQYRNGVCTVSATREHAHGEQYKT